MSKENSTEFDGFNIESLEQGLGLKVPQSGSVKTQGSGEPGDDAKGSGEGQDNKEKTGVQMPGHGNFIQVPETEEEAKSIYGEDFITGSEEKDDTKSVKNKTEGDDKTGGASGEEVEDQKKTGQEGEDAKVTEDSPLYLHAATLQEKGILPNLDLDKIKELGHDDAVQYILDAQKDLVDQGKDEFKNSLSEDQRNYLDMIEKGVPDNEARDMAIIEKAYRDITDEVMADDEELQKEIIFNANQLKGLKPEKIKIILEKAEEDGKLFEEAKESKADIDAYLATEKQKKLDLAKEQQDKRDLAEKELQTKIKSSVEGIDEILPGIKVTDEEKKSILEYMTKPVDTVVKNGRQYPVNYINQKRNQDRVDFDIKLNYFIKLGLFDKDADLSKLTKRTKTSAAEKLSKKLRGDDTSEGISVNERKNQGSGSNEKMKIQFPNEINNF